MRVGTGLNSIAVKRYVNSASTIASSYKTCHITQCSIAPSATLATLDYLS